LVLSVSSIGVRARESLTSFAYGAGDAAIIYEKEVLAARRVGRALDYIIKRLHAYEYDRRDPSCLR
jgi:hypothetical protein